MESALGNEAKNATNSSSALELQAGRNNGQLTLWRISTEFYVYRQLDNETEWTLIDNAITNEAPSTQIDMIVNIQISSQRVNERSNTFLICLGYSSGYSLQHIGLHRGKRWSEWRDTFAEAAIAAQPQRGRNRP